MDSTSRAVPPSSGDRCADRPYAEPTSGLGNPSPLHTPRAGGLRTVGRVGPGPSGVRWASSFPDAGPPALAPALRDPGLPLLRPWGTGAGTFLSWPKAGTRTVPAVPVPRGIAVL
jgi:hypothetical protein